MQRRLFLSATATTAAAACGLVAAPLTAVAQGLPRGPVRIVVGFPPGGGTDVVARVIAQQLAILWGIPVLVENRAGAAGVIAAGYVAKLPADGSTLLMTNFSNHAVAPSLYPKLDYVIERDFTPIMLVGIVPSILVCRPNQPAQTVQAIIERCRATPGSVSFGSAGPGSVQHLALEMFKLRAGIDALHVPYKGSAPMITDLIGGQIDYSFETMSSAAPHVASGKLLPIAQTRLRPAAAMPKLPTLAESGFAGFDASTWYGLAGPGQMDTALVKRMNDDFNRVLLMPAVADKLLTFGAEDGGGTPAQFAAFIDTEKGKWAKVIRDAKVSI
jgi:tripartite-type tricarboxylate transporter receptor subunit TctC